MSWISLCTLQQRCLDHQRSTIKSNKIHKFEYSLLPSCFFSNVAARLDPPPFVSLSDWAWLRSSLATSMPCSQISTSLYVFDGSSTLSPHVPWGWRHTGGAEEQPPPPLATSRGRILKNGARVAWRVVKNAGNVAGRNRSPVDKEQQCIVT